MTSRQKVVLELVRMARFEEDMRGATNEWIGSTKITNDMRDYARSAYYFSAHLAAVKLFGRKLRLRKS